MLDNHNTLFKSSRIDKVCRAFAENHPGCTFGGIEKYRYNPYNRQASGSDSDRQVAFVHLNFKESKAPRMENVLFEIFKEIIRYMSVSVLRELTICLVCKCNKSFDCPGVTGDDERSIRRCNDMVAKDIAKNGGKEGHWTYVSNNRRGSNALINRFFRWRRNGLDTGFYVMLMKSAEKLTDQKIKYYANQSWANAIQTENKY